MKRQTICFLTAILVLSVITFQKASLAAPYYEGKRITIVVGFGPGGGYDAMARLVAKYLPKYIPGKPVILVENMPGASSIIAANHIFSIAKPDGFTIGTVNRGLPFAQLTKAEGVKFDFRKYSWIGSPSVDPTVLFVRAELPIRNVEDLRKTKGPIPLATEGLGTTGHQFPILLNEFAGMNFKLVVYPSGADSNLALERKEVDGRAASYSSVKRYVDRGLLRPLIRGRASLPEIENLVLNESLTTDPKGKTIMGMLSSVDMVARPFLVPPGVPGEVMAILREAFAKVTEDPEMKAEAKNLSIDLRFVSAEESLKVLDYLFNQPDSIVKEFAKFVTY